MSVSKFLLAATVATGALASIPSASAQVSVQLGTITADAPEPGLTNTINLSTGSRTSLVVGNSTNFGAASSLSISEGVTAHSSSTLIPTSIKIGSSIGNNALQETKISISNLTSKDMVSTMTSTDDGNGSIDVDKSDNGGSEASGNVEITGMISDVVLDIRTADTFYPVQDGVDADGNPTYTAVQHVGPGDASFDVAVYPNLELDSDEFPSDACVANARACHFVDTDKLKTGNANASANLNTQTNVDINASEFTNLFTQSF